MDIGVYGGSGRMGTVFSRYAKEKGHNIFIIDRKSPELNMPFYKDIKEIINSIDVVVDFSSPDALNNLIPIAEQFQKPLVSGTTGIDDNIMARLREAGKVIPVLYAPNFSLGIMLIQMLLHNIPKSLLNEFNIYIEEIHHKNKKDKPSGTAKMLAKMLNNPEILSVRIGDEKGTHRIYFYGEDEVIELSHRAVSRIIFAKGALKAAELIIDKPPGFYTMEELWTGRK